MVWEWQLVVSPQISWESLCSSSFPAASSANTEATGGTAAAPSVGLVTRGSLGNAPLGNARSEDARCPLARPSVWLALGSDGFRHSELFWLPEAKG